MNINKAASLDSMLVDIFCNQFGDKYRNKLSPETNMDAIEEWDSLSFLDLVAAIEEAYGLTFTNTEASQMFQLGHIQRILDNTRYNLPHDDVAHACCQLKILNDTKPDRFNIVILSGSSTREGLVTAIEAKRILREMTQRDNINWFNISVSGLVVAETLLLTENLNSLPNTFILIGYSPIILGGCGEAEFWRSARHERFPFNAPEMDRMLFANGYELFKEPLPSLITLDIWAERYLRGRTLDEMQYDPYLYPTLAPWKAKQFKDRKSILRFYNDSVLNFQQSVEINKQLLIRIIDILNAKGLRFGLLELPLHSNMITFLEKLGGVVTETEHFIEKLITEYNVPYLEVVKTAGITDSDFRDPAHIFRKRDAYTRMIIEEMMRYFQQGEAVGPFALVK